MKGGKENIINNIKALLKPNELIVDVRERPFGLINMPDLRRELRDQYFWAKEWGNPSYKNAETFKERLTKIINYSKLKGLDTLILMCAEVDVNRCHRKDIKQKIIHTLPECEDGEDIGSRESKSARVQSPIKQRTLAMLL